MAERIVGTRCHEAFVQRRPRRFRDRLEHGDETLHACLDAAHVVGDQRLFEEAQEIHLGGRVERIAAPAARLEQQLHARAQGVDLVLMRKLGGAQRRGGIRRRGGDHR